MSVLCVPFPCPNNSSKTILHRPDQLLNWFLWDTFPLLNQRRFQLIQAWRSRSSGTNPILQFIPHVLNRIQVRAERRPVQCGDIDFFEVFSCSTGSVTTSVIVLKEEAITGISRIGNDMFQQNIGNVPVRSWPPPRPPPGTKTSSVLPSKEMPAHIIQEPTP